MNDDLNPFIGMMRGCLLGAVVWLIIISVIWAATH